MADTTAKEIIVQAFSEGGFAPRGRMTLAEEMQEALPVLNGLLISLLGVELGEHYREWPIPPNRASAIPSRYPLGPINQDPPRDVWTNPPANVRLIAANTEAVTIYFPQSPQDGARMAYTDAGATADLTLHGNGRLIQGLPSVTGTGGTRRWFYRADRSNWICFGKVGMDEMMPLPLEFDDLFICGLYLRLCPRFKQEMHPMYEGRYRDMLSRLRKRYKQSEEQPVAAPLSFPSMGGYNATVIREI